MRTIRINASKTYNVIIGTNVLEKLGEYVSQINHSLKALVVSDNIVHDLYGSVVYNSLKQAGYKVFESTFINGEESKNLNTYSEIINYLAENDFVRTDVIIALGGGVVGDISGFAASTYMRGIDYVQIPTTLLAMIDSSVGGKTAVDLPSGKNLVGAFHQPILVLEDTNTLNTLPCRQYKNGLGEVIKTAILTGGEIVKIVKDGVKCTSNINIDKLLALCVDYKRQVIEADEKESGIRKLLNLGHTFAHALEKQSNYTKEHGVCVASGIEIISRISYRQNKLSKNDYDTIIQLLEQYDLYDSATYDLSKMIDIIRLDKKVNGEFINLIIPYSIGDCRIESVEINKLEEYLKC